MEKIISIHGTSSKVTFECEDVRIIGSGEFFAEIGEIGGFVVSTVSLRYLDGEFLTSDEKEELMLRYEEYVNQPHFRSHWSLEFD